MFFKIYIKIPQPNLYSFISKYSHVIKPLACLDYLKSKITNKNSSFVTFSSKGITSSASLRLLFCCSILCRHSRRMRAYACAPKIIRIRVEIPNRNWSSYVVWAPHLPKLMDCPAEPRTPNPEPPIQMKPNAGRALREWMGGRRRQGASSLTRLRSISVSASLTMSATRAPLLTRETLTAVGWRYRSESRKCNAH